MRIALCALHYVHCTMHIALYTLHYTHYTIHTAKKIRWHTDKQADKQAKWHRHFLSCLSQLKITADWAVPHCEFCQFPAQHLQTISSKVRSVRIWQLKKMFIILVITSTLLENSRFHVLKYIKASINPKVFTNLPFFQENSTLLPLPQASWFLIECQYLLTLIF